MSQSDEIVVLPDSFTIAQVERLFEMLSNDVFAGSLRIDGSQVLTADTAGIQLLLVVKNRLLANGGSIEWTGMSDSLRKAAITLGLNDLVVN